MYLDILKLQILFSLEIRHFFLTILKNVLIFYKDYKPISKITQIKKSHYFLI